MKSNLRIQIKNKMKEAKRVEKENQQNQRKKRRVVVESEDSKESLVMLSAD